MAVSPSPLALMVFATVPSVSPAFTLIVVVEVPSLNWKLPDESPVVLLATVAEDQPELAVLPKLAVKSEAAPVEELTRANLEPLEPVTMLAVTPAEDELMALTRSESVLTPAPMVKVLCVPLLD